jgi:ketosteroid isomerase-like protein
MTKLMIALLAVAAFATSALAADPTSTATAVDEAFKQNCEAGNVPGVLALYADDAIAVWLGQGEQAKGRPTSRSWRRTSARTRRT